MWILYGLLAGLAAALMTVCAKIGLKTIDPTLATTVRAGIMFGCMLLASFATKKPALLGSFDGRAWRWVVLAGLCGALSWTFYFFGLQQTTASKLAALDRLSLPLIILLSTLVLGEKLSWQLALGGALVTGGAVLIARA